MAGPDDPPTVEQLIGETRLRREELHSFIDRMRENHRAWADSAEALAHRERLTTQQRNQFRGYLSRLKNRRLP
jgi:hypothetical protein